jgi:integrase
VKNHAEACAILYNRSNGSNGEQETSRVSIEEFIPKFKKYLKDKGKKKSTIEAYSCDIQQLMTSLPYYINEVQSKDIEHAISKLDIKPVTRNGKAKSLSRFFNVAKIKGIIDSNPVQGFEFTKTKKEINPYNEHDIFKLIEAGQRLEERYNEPYHAFIILAFQDGLRLDEYVNLRWKYLAGNSYRLCIDETFRPKHDVERTIKIPKRALKLLNGIPKLEGCDYIFHTKKGQRHHHFTRDFVNNIFKAAGIKGNLKRIRQTFASYRLAYGQPIQNLSKHLGHSNIKELVAYIGVVNNTSAKLKEIFGDY